MEKSKTTPSRYDSDAFCLSCGAVRRVSSRYLATYSTRRLACAECGCATDHERTNRGRFGEMDQKKYEEEAVRSAELLRRLAASKARIEQLGVRLEYESNLHGDTADGSLTRFSGHIGCGDHAAMTAAV